MLIKDFLKRDYYDWANEFLNLSEPALKAFYQETDRINNDPKLQQLAQEFHLLLYHSGESIKEINDKLLSMGPDEGMFAAVVYVSGLPTLIETYRSKGISLDILRETLSDLEIWMNNHYQKYGVWGLSELGWLKWHFRGGLFKLGRLQFMPRSYDGKVKVFRNRDSGSVIALSDAGVTYGENGQMAIENNSKNSTDAWVSIFQDDGYNIKGNMVTSEGIAIREPIELSLQEWELVLEDGDQVLDVHIPEGGKMSYELCAESYRQAAMFAEKHLSDQAIKAFTCTSWLLSPQFGQILAEESNIMKFQSDYYNTPVLFDDVQMFERVFGKKPDDLSKAPRDTSLRRSLLDYLLAGNTVQGGSGFILL